MPEAMAVGPQHPVTERGRGSATQRGLWVLVPAIGIMVAFGVATWLSGGSGSRSPGAARGGDGADGARPMVVEGGKGGEPVSVSVSSDAPVLTSLDELVNISSVVVEAEVVSSVDGRWFGAGEGDATASGGDGGDGGVGEDSAILSRLVTLRVTEVLGGTAPMSPTVLVEEEGWTADGRPLVVDGLGAAAIGDRGIWFLVEGGDPELGAYLVVSSQGRYLERGREMVGADGTDALVAELSAMSPAELADAVTRSDRSG